MDPWNTQVNPAPQGMMSPNIKAMLQALLGGGQNYFSGMGSGAIGAQNKPIPVTPTPGVMPSVTPPMGQTPSMGGEPVPGLGGVQSGFNDFLGAIQKRMGG